MATRSRGPVRWRLLFPALVLCLTAGALPAQNAPYPEPEGVSRARRKLSTLHLMRGIHLDLGQVDMLETLAQAAKRHRDGFLTRDRERWERFEADIELYIDQLLDGTSKDGLEDPLGYKVYMAGSDDRAIANDWLARLVELERTARELLRPEQLRVVEGFTRCVVAPQYMADPERVGEAGKSSVYLDQLRQVREIGRDRWEIERDSWIDAFLRGVEGEVGPLSPELRKELGDTCRNNFELVRSLDPLTFRIRQQELTEFIDLESQEQLYYKDYWEHYYEQAGGPGPVAHWLLSELALELYPRLRRSIQDGVELPEAPAIFATRCVSGEDGTKHCATGSVYSALQTDGAEGSRP